MNSSRLVRLAGPLVLASACASTGALTSLDDLTAQVEPSGFLEALPQQRVLSLSAMVPSGEPGRVFRYHNTRSPFTSFGISKRVHGYGRCRVEGTEKNLEPLPAGEDPGPAEVEGTPHPQLPTEEPGASCEKPQTESYYLRRVVPYLPDDTPLALLEEVEQKERKAEETRASHEENPNDEALRKEADAAADAYRDAYRRAVQSVAGVPPELLELRNLISRVRLLASKVVRLRLEATASGHTAVTTDDRDRTQALEDDAAKAMKRFEKVLQEATAAVDRPGVMVIRYSISETKSLGARIGAIFGADGEQRRDESGFAVLAGIEVATLYIGEDFEEWAEPPGSDWSLIGTRFPFLFGSKFPYIGQWSVDHAHVVTSRLAAEHVVYGSDRLTERRIRANVEASVEQLQNLGETLAEIDEVAIDGVLSSVESLGNTGVLGAMFQQVVPECQWERLRPRAPQDVYLVMTDYDDLMRFASSKPRLHLSRW